MVPDALTGIVRNDRFCEGTIKATLEDGTLSAALQRLLRWYDQERAAGRLFGADSIGERVNVTEQGQLIFLSDELAGPA